MHSFQEIHTIFENHLKENLRFPAEPENLFDPCRKLLAAGGKRIRPALCLMANELFGPLQQNAFHFAMAIELFHNFTLIHDDLMDQAPLRRGQATVHETHGLPGAVLAGDAMFVFAVQQLNLVEHPQKTEITTLFHQAALDVCIGQQLDMDFERSERPSRDAYLQMITLKTSVLLGLSLEVGALLGGASLDERNALYRFGKNLGIAFQLKDDYLDAFGDEQEIGKLPGGDIRSNKKTFLTICAHERMTSEHQGQLEAYQHLPEQEKVTETIALYRKSGVDEIAEQEYEHYTRQAFADLELLQKGERLAPLRALGYQLMNRTT